MRIIATDTETENGKAILITKPWAFCEPSSWEDCIEFLSQDRQLACFNSDYDAQALMKWLPALVRNRAALLGEASYGGYRIRYIPHKFFKVWRLGLLKKQDRLMFVMYDMRQFYNCSMARAAEKLGVQRKGEIPKSWYTQMLKKLKDPKTRSRLIAYALGDAQTLQQIIDRTVEAFRVAGLKFERPYSNASFAERYFHKKFKYKRKMPVEQWARQAYHGGRIECLRCGFFPVAHYYDIHSAYPSIIASLVKPDGKWVYEKRPSEIREDAVYAFVDCEFTIPKDTRACPIPVRRRSGSILYPSGHIRKIVTLSEFRYLERQGWVDRIQASWSHIWPRWNYPFREITEIYKRRKEDPKADYALKIVMNSVYGKMAQVIESRTRTNKVDRRSEIFDGRVWRKKEKWKDHTSFVYAAEITARIRMKLLEDIPPENVISYSTDGVFTLKPLGYLRTGPGLGDWGEGEKVKNLIVVGSGVYTYKGKEGTIVRFRGFSPNIDLAAMLKKAGRRHSIGMHVIRNTSIKQAAKGGSKQSQMNVLEKVTRYMNVNFDIKRNWPKKWSAIELTRKQFDSKAWVYYKPVSVRR